MSGQKEEAKCEHLVAWKDMCAKCGLDLTKLDAKPPTSSESYVSMIHTVPDLKVNLTDARIIDKGEETRLLQDRKLHLLVDLDQTLIHTTNDDVPNNLQDVIHFQLWGPNSPWYHTRLRPGTRDFLKKISNLYQLHICTFGTRHYAHIIARHLDPEGKYFYNRILSRDECFSQNSKTANLKELFPNGDHMVCIIDDREDVWNFAPNLIHVKPYHFFRHTGDINAPPGLAKKDHDDKTGIDFSKVGPNVEIIKAVKPQIAEADSTTTNEVNSVPSNSGEQGESKDKKELKRQVSAQVTNDLELSSESSDSSSSDSSSSSSSDSEGKANDGDSESGNENSVDKKCDNSSKPASGASANAQDLKTAPEENAAIVNSNEIETEHLSSPSAGSVNSESNSPLPDSQVSSQNKEKDPTSTNSELSDQQKDKEPDNPEISATNESVLPPPAPGEDVVKVEDQDDYLMYLEDILRQIHLAYYTIHDESKGQEKYQGTDVKVVIPYVRKKILKGCSIVFSGVVPVDQPIESSRAYSVAISLGAVVTDKIIPPAKPNAAGSSKEASPTTHVVAARPGTAKVNDARRYKNMNIVTPDWLWCCSERWEHVDEKLFSLYNSKSSPNKDSPARAHGSRGSSSKHKRSSKKGVDEEDAIFESTGSQGSQQKPIPAGRRNRTPSGRFMDTINPLLSFSMDEIESMGHEVDDICGDTSSSSSSVDEEDTATPPAPNRKVSRSQSTHDQENARILAHLQKIKEKESSSSSGSDLDSSQETSEKRKRKHDETETDDEPLNSKFRRGEALPSDIDTLNLTNASSDDDDEVEVNQEDERMAQEVEAGFLDELDDSQDQFD